jgi:hypothetical protein
MKTKTETRSTAAEPSIRDALGDDYKPAAEMLPPLKESMVYSAANIPLLADPKGKPRDIFGELLRQGERAVVGSTSKSMKSWLVTLASVCKAAGLEWLGHPMAAGPVLHIDIELLRWFLDDRVRIICRALGIAHPEQLNLWSMRGVKPRPTMPQLIAEIKRRYAPGAFEFVVLEPSYKLVNPTEQGTNSEMMVAAYLEALDEIACYLGAAVLTTHHSPKGDLSNRSSIDLFSGTGTWARDPDLLMTLRAHEEEGHSVLQMTRRHGAPEPDMVCKWEFPLWVPQRHMDATAIAKPGKKKRKEADSILKLLEAAPQNGWTTKEWELAAIRKGVGKSTFYELKKSAEVQEAVEVLGSGRHPTYRLKDRPF